MPTCLVGGWQLSFYWVRIDKQDPSYTLMADTVSFEVCEAWEGGWSWMRQNNHFTPRANRVMATGGNVTRVDGSGQWYPNEPNGTTWGPTSQYAEHWPNGHCQAEACDNTVESAAASAYYFDNPNHATPSGARRGVLVP